MTKAAELAKMGEVLTNSQIGGRRNLIINGAMQVAQRGTSLAMAHDGNTGNYLIDRFQCLFGGSPSTLDGTYAQVADHPLESNGKSLKWTTGTAESAIASDELLLFQQKVEAQNLQNLQFASSNALKTTLSFYVKSSITGTFATSLRKRDTTERIINKTYTINSANTWERKILTFDGDTDSGAGIANDNGEGIRVIWHLMAGTDFTTGSSTSGWKDFANADLADGQATNAIATTAGATWQITDCQWEVGSVATPFEHRSFGEERQLCYRYYYRTPDEVAGGLGVNETYPCFGNMDGTSTGAFLFVFPVPMRAAPTAFEQSGTASHYSVRVTGDQNGTSVPTATGFTSEKALVNLATGGGFTSGDGAFMRSENDDGFIAFSAEL